MLKAFPDKLTIVAPHRRQIKSVALGFALAVLLAGCAGAPERGGAPEQPDAASYNEVAWSEEISFHLGEAERSSAVGDHESALLHLLAAARESGDPELARQVVALAWRLNEWNSLVEAAELWQAADAQAADARRLRALGLLNSGREAETIELMSAWLAGAESSERPQIWRELGQLLAAAEDEALALAVMEAVVAGAPMASDDPEILRARSQLKWQLEQVEEALALALAAAERSGDRAHLVWAAQLSTAVDDYEQALRLYRQARVGAPEEVPLGLSEAEMLRQLGRLDEALVVLAALDDDLDVLFSRASYQQLAGQETEARETWERMAAWGPAEDINHHAFLVAWLGESLGLQAEAAQWYARVRGGPNVDRALLRRAVLLADEGRLEESRQLLMLARDTEQRELREQSWLIESELLREAGQADAAVELLGAALREAPGSIALLYARAIHAVEIDDLALAEQDLRRIIQIDANSAMALNALGYTLTDRTTRHAEAYRLIRRALELSPDEPAILDSMGWVYFRLGRPETALGYLERALEGEDNPEIAAHLAEVLWHLDQPERARAVLHSAWERHPGDRDLADTMDRLELQP